MIEEVRASPTCAVRSVPIPPSSAVTASQRLSTEDIRSCGCLLVKRRVGTVSPSGGQPDFELSRSTTCRSTPPSYRGADRCLARGRPPMHSRQARRRVLSLCLQRTRRMPERRCWRPDTGSPCPRNCAVAGPEHTFLVELHRTAVECDLFSPMALLAATTTLVRQASARHGQPCRSGPPGRRRARR
jgi:hypothetical protein